MATVTSLTFRDIECYVCVCGDYLNQPSSRAVKSLWILLLFLNHFELVKSWQLLSSYRRPLINGFSIPIAYFDSYPSKTFNSNNHKLYTITIYTFKRAHLFTAIVWVKRPLFQVQSWCCRYLIVLFSLYLRYQFRFNCKKWE